MTDLPHDRPSPPVLVYRLGSLGDMCVALPALKAVRARWPDSRIVLLTNFSIEGRAAPAQSLLEGSGLVDGYIAYPVGTRNPAVLARLMAKVRRGGFACVVNLAGWRGRASAWRDRTFFRLAGISDARGFGRDEAGAVRVRADGSAESEAARLFRRVRTITDLPAPDARAHRIDFTPEEAGRARALLAGAGIAPGFLAVSVGGKGSAKDWTQENWTALIRRLPALRPAWGLVVLGAAQERARGDEFRPLWPGPFLNLSGACTARESAAVLSLAAAYVGHDSGPIHLAAAVGVRCVGIYAARDPAGLWFPQGEGHAVLYHRTECAGCHLDECVRERKRCILSITVEEVEGALRSILEGRA